MWGQVQPGVQGQFGGGAMPQPAQVLPANVVPGVSYDPSLIPPAPANGAQMQYQPQPGVVGTPIAGFPQQQPNLPLGYQPQQPQLPQQFQIQPQQQMPQFPQQQMQQQYPQQPQFQQQPQFGQQQAPAQQQGITDETILNGPGVPPELRGRTMREARMLFSALSQDWLQRNRQPTTPAQQTLQSQGLGFPQQPTPPAQHQFGQQQGAQPNAFQAQMQPIVQQAVQQAVQPLLQQSQSQAIMQAREMARTGIQDFSYLEPYVMQQVAGMSPEALQNPAMWELATDAARGKLQRQGMYRPQQMQQQPQTPGRQQFGPGVSQPAPQPLHGFFVEGPSAPNVPGNGFATAQVQATQQDQMMAQRFQMPLPQYMAWKHGQVPQQAAPAWGGF